MFVSSTLSFTECQPGLPDGNFIMFASATSGDKPNNGKFSPCSVKNISAVLAVVLKSMPVDPTRNASPVGIGKRNCFQERTSAFCGNQIYEPGEECDCGFSQADCDQMGDKCCVPHEARGNGGPGPCKRKPGAQCSPSQGYCCNPDTCSLHGKNEEKICRQVFCIILIKTFYYIFRNLNVQTFKLVMEEMHNAQSLHQNTMEFHVKTVQKFARVDNVMDQFVQCLDWKTVSLPREKLMSYASWRVLKMEVSFKLLILR